MVIFPNAKINLGLNIIERRSDNFHNIETVFYPIPWNDILEIIPAQSFDFHSSGNHIDCEIEKNLCVKVYRGLEKEFNLPGAKMHLHKIIPSGAGLGGGSSDASFTLKVLNEIYRLNLSQSKMEEIIRPYGSDCAFFIQNKPLFAYGKGDVFEEIQLNLSGKWILLVYPDLHISTQEAYSGVRPTRPKVSIKEILSNDISEWKNSLINDFEISLFPRYPLLDSIKQELYSRGAIYASMSGSGSTIFGIFDNEITTEDLFPKGFNLCLGKL